MNIYETAKHILESKSLTAKEIRAAYDKHKGNLKAVESKCCPGTEHLSVMNQGVLIRYMLLELGFTEKEIEDSK